MAEREGEEREGVLFLLLLRCVRGVDARARGIPRQILLCALVALSKHNLVNDEEKRVETESTRGAAGVIHSLAGLALLAQLS